MPHPTIANLPIVTYTYLVIFAKDYLMPPAYSLPHSDNFCAKIITNMIHNSILSVLTLQLNKMSILDYLSFKRSTLFCHQPKRGQQKRCP